MTRSCFNTSPITSKEWDKKEIVRWFTGGEWLEGWTVMPDASIDLEEFAKYYVKDPARWKKAFEFLARSNLASIAPGRYELDGDNLFVNVEEYFTRDEEETCFETHKQYADIQYVVSGEEKIGLTAFTSMKEICPYDHIKDISFFSAPHKNYRLANPERFFIFFSEDAHSPCVKANQCNRVKKVVVKVRID
jgi:YhcH/YjgK/YiaL family protein